MIHGRKKDVFRILPPGFGKSLIFQIVLRFTKEKNDGPGHNTSTTYDVKPLFSRNEEIYVSKEVKENALASEGKSCQQETITAENQYAYMSHPLTVKQAAKIKFALSKCRFLQSIIYLPEKKFIGTGSILA